MRSSPYLLLALLLVLGAPRPGPAQAAPDAATPSARKPAAKKPVVGKHESTRPRGGKAGDAKGTPELAALRDRLDRLARDPKAGATESVRLSITHTVDVAERIAKKFPTQAAAWRARAAAYLDAAERGRDPYPEARGQIVSRGYRSPISQTIQGYTVYVPPDYTPDKRWPLMIVLHGGSSNGNLFLGVVLGNNMDWKTYDQHLWDTYQPRWSPNFIVAAPDGYGQVLWRWMGEQDVLDVIADLQKSYQVDAERIVLSGLSNGGVGAYAIGSRHAHRFSVVQAIAGAPSWLQYAGAGSVPPIEATLMRPWSAMDLAENWFNTDFRYYHGTVDPGPMRPAYVRALDASLAARSIPHTGKWFEAGHDLLYMVHRHGKLYAELEGVRRKVRPSAVHLVSGDYRAARQHWLELTRFQRYPELAKLVGKADGGRVEVTTENTTAFVVHVAELPAESDDLTLFVDGTCILEEKRSALPARLELVRDPTTQRFQRGTPSDAALAKRPGLSGPMTDLYYDRMVHVYGTKRPENVAALSRAAQQGARGYPLWLWTVAQEVLPDTAVTPDIAQSAHLVLYGTPGDNAVLDRIADRLPIRVDGTSVLLGDQRFSARGVGTRFVYPNPEARARYVMVFSAPTIDGVRRGLNLPDFLPDYVVYDAQSASARTRLVPGKHKPTRGFFGARWELSP